MGGKFPPPSKMRNLIVDMVNSMNQLQRTCREGCSGFMSCCVLCFRIRGFTSLPLGDHMIAPVSVKQNQYIIHAGPPSITNIYNKLKSKNVPYKPDRTNWTEDYRTVVQVNGYTYIYKVFIKFHSAMTENFMWMYIFTSGWLYFASPFDTETS